jgi:TATA-box binding protein (TBP) (component of TFIID and TFIIIB)
MELQNSTFTFKLSKRLNLNELQRKSKLIAPVKRLKAAKARCQNVTFMLYEKQNCVMLGAKSVEQGLSALEGMTVALRKLTNDSSLMSEHLKLCNCVYSQNFGCKIDLIKFYDHDRRAVYFNPECFSGANICIDSVTFLVFSSGKVVITGATDFDLIKQAYMQLVNRLQSCKR